MIAGARYAHTNLIARDWRALARFYQELFGCTVVPPERDYAGPTLEIFQYAELAPGVEARVNRPGFGHIAFAVDSVPLARAQVLAAAGRAVGEVVTLESAGGARVTWCYVTDPEGNVLELQAWH